MQHEGRKYGAMKQLLDAVPQIRLNEKGEEKRTKSRHPSLYLFLLLPLTYYTGEFPVLRMGGDGSPLFILSPQQFSLSLSVAETGQ